MSLLEPVAVFAYRSRRALLMAFFALFACAGLYGRGVASKLVAGGFEDPHSESARADALLDESFALGTPDVAVAYSHPAGLEVGDPDFERLLRPALARMQSVPGVERVGTPYDAKADALVSRDRRIAVVTIRLAGSGHAAQASYDALAPHLRVAGLESLVGGAQPAARQAQAAAEHDLARAERVTLPLVGVLLVVFFRGLVVAALPLLIGGFSVAAALACVRLLTHITDVSIFALNIVTFVGLGVAIDYSLFMASRFRDELALGGSVERAVVHTLRSAGRTIGYSGGAVTVSLLAMAVFPLMLLRSVAIAGSLVVLMSLLGTLLFLPALLAALGPRIEWLSFQSKSARAREISSERATEAHPRQRTVALASDLRARQVAEGAPVFWRHVANAVMRAPWTVTLLVTAALIVLGLPFRHIRASVSGASVLPEEAEARQVAELLDSPRFPAHESSAIEVFATFDASESSQRAGAAGAGAQARGSSVWSEAALRALAEYADRLARVPHAVRVDAPAGGSSGRTGEALSAALAGPQAALVRAQLAPLLNERAAALRVALDVSPNSEEAKAAVRALRAIHVPGLTGLAASPAARVLDLQHALGVRMPYALAIICLATFVVLFLAFGSVVMPIKAILMNVLSLSASFGALVWIFQEGRLQTVLRFASPGTIELTIPVVMFAVVFGLAMDYELFLLSRVREAYDETHDTHQSVTIGLERTAQIITRAALLLVAVMAGFASADMLLVKELGVGMAIAVIVDATIVRALLVPATMQLLGRYNWWAPRPLARAWSRLHLGIDERQPRELERAGT